MAATEIGTRHGMRRNVNSTTTVNNTKITTKEKRDNDEAEEGEEQLSYTLCDSQVHAGCRERFLLTGYRSENMPPSACLKTMFKRECNETLNIWTHLVPFFLFLLKFGVMFTTVHPLTDPFYWPLASNAVGILGFCITSSMAHTFCALSPGARYVCFYMDYAIINVYSGSGWQAFFFYGRPVSSPDNVGIFTVENVQLMALVCFKISIISTFQCCCSRHVKNVFEHLMRVSSFVVPWLCAAFPYLYRLHTCMPSESPDCHTESFTPFAVHTVLYVVGALALASKLPERFWPGAFDFVGHSHQVMHICVAAGAYFQFESIRMEMIRQEDVLRGTKINQLYSIYNLPLTVVTFVANVVIALYFPLVRPYLFKEEDATMEDIKDEGEKTKVL